MDLYTRLEQAVTLASDDAAVVLAASLESIGGGSARVFPPTYPLDAVNEPEPTEPRRKLPYVIEPRLVDGREATTVLLDSVQAQANRHEEAIEDAVLAGRLRLPYLLIEQTLPSGRRVRVTSFTAPHRVGDAYWRDGLVGDIAFDKSPVGLRLRQATAEDCRPWYEREPLSLVLGAWDSHRKGRQARFPRLYRSEMFGVAPTFGRRAAGRMDPHNLVGAVSNPAAATDGTARWEHVVPDKRAAKGEKLSEIGHGNIAPGAAHGGATVVEVRRLASISMAGLARLRFGDAPPQAATAARVALAALALAGDRLAFGGASVWLRSGCELVVRDEHIAWHQRGGRTDPVTTLSADEAIAVFEQARARAAQAGLVMAEDVVRLTPGKGLAGALEYAYLTATEDIA